MCTRQNPLEASVTSVQQDVLRFDVRVDDAAALMQEAQPCQHLGKQQQPLSALTGSPTISPVQEQPGTVGMQVIDLLVLKEASTDEVRSQLFLYSEWPELRGRGCLRTWG